MAYDLGYVDIETGVDSGELANGKIKTSFDNAETALNELAGPKDSVLLTPQAEQPSPHVVGRVYFDADAGTTKIQGGITGVEVEVGHGEHIHVVNNSGALIEKGMACRHNGVVGGNVQIVKAVATSFENALVFGLASIDIPHGEEGALTTSGEIKDLDTNGLPVGVPLYLSASVPGTYGTSIPSIISQVGGSLVEDALTGRFYVQTISNSNLPTVFGGLQGQTAGNETYSLTATAQDIINYETTKEVVVTVNALTGEITLPNTGGYRMHFTAAISFVTSTSTRSVTIELYDVTGSVIHFPYVKNIPRDATDDSLSFSWPIDEIADNVHKMRIKSSVAMDITFNELSFDIESVYIQ